MRPISSQFKRIYQLVFIDGSSHQECFQRLQLSASPPVSTHDFSEALSSTYRLVGCPGGARAAGNAPAPTSAPTPEQQTLAAAEVAHIVGWPNAKMVYNRVPRALALLRRELDRTGMKFEDLQAANALADLRARLRRSEQFVASCPSHVTS